MSFQDVFISAEIAEIHKRTILFIFISTRRVARKRIKLPRHWCVSADSTVNQSCVKVALDFGIFLD
jgi:hypothetical protein